MAERLAKLDRENRVQLKYVSEYANKEAVARVERHHAREVARVEEGFRRAALASATAHASSASKPEAAPRVQPAVPASPALFLAAVGLDGSDGKGADSVPKEKADSGAGSGEPAAQKASAPPSRASAADWRQQLTAEQRRQMAERLAKLDRENRVQLKYASEYGKEAVAEQERHHAREVARVEEGYRRAALASAAGLGRSPAGARAASLTAGSVAGSVSFGLAGAFAAVAAAIAVTRRARAESSAREPLLTAA